MNIQKLINKGRLIPVHAVNKKGVTELIAYRRKPGSGKAGLEYRLRTPEPVSAGIPVAAGEVAVPEAAGGDQNAG